MSKQTKTIFITGGSSGFGKSISEQALNAGHRVVATFRKQEEADQFNQLNQNAIGVLMDVTDKDQIRSAVELTVQKFNTIDVLVNNAGYGEFGLVEAIEQKDFDKQFDVNVTGLLNVTKALLPHMRGNDSGQIINFSSIGGLVSMPTAGVYCASKFAVEGLTLALREEVKNFGIKVTLIEPGAFDTKFGENSTFAKLGDNTPKEYESFVDGIVKHFSELMGNPENMGDPDKLAAAVLHIINNDIDSVHVPLGADAVEGFKSKIKILQEAVNQWEKIGSQMSNKDDLPKILAR